MKNIIPLILGMAIVTYLPRVFPLLALTDRRTNKKFKEFLTLIPYTSLSILILKGIITAEEGMKIPTIVGISASAIIGYINGNLVLSIFGGIICSFIAITLLH